MRSKILLLTIVVAFSVNIARLFYWQTIKAPQLKKKSISQSYKLTAVSPPRGLIFSSDNFPLTINKNAYLLSVYKPNLKDNLKTVLSKISYLKPEFISENQNLIDNFVQKNEQKWLTFPTSFSQDESQELALDGVTFEKIEKRIYPEDNLAKTVIGSTHKTYTGQLIGTNGLEFYYNKQLTGKNGIIQTTTDATGQTILSKKNWNTEIQNGLNLHTSLKRNIQFIVENNLKKGIEKYSADSGSIIIMDPQTGSILAMSSFISDTATKSSNNNLSTSSLFEPGSIFKPLVIAMSLEKGSIDTNFICDQCNHPFKVDEYTIENWNGELHPNSSLRDIVKNSDNIGMSIISKKLGQENMLSFFSLLELTQKSGIDLPGEAKPLIKKRWTNADLATASFGQGFAINQLQMLRAFNVLANNGFLISPTIVDYFTKDAKTIKINKSAPIKVFSHETINKVNSILKYSVENGTIAKLKPNNIEVCAKSGTAQVAIGGTYTESNTIASYIGFSPCQKPKFSMIVTINNPKTSPWGSSTAAPIWFDIASSVFYLL